MNDHLTQKKYLCKADRALQRRGGVLNEAPDHDILHLALGGDLDKKALLKGLDLLPRSYIHFDDLLKIKGMTPRCASILIAIQHLSEYAAPDETVRIKLPYDVAQFASRYTDGTQGFFAALFLNGAHHALHFEVLSATPKYFDIVSNKELFCLACNKRATGIILVVHVGKKHSVRPSPEQIMNSKRIAAVGKIIGIDLLDVVITGEHTFYSFAKHDRL